MIYVLVSCHRGNSLEMSLFPEILRAQDPSKIANNNSQGITFVVSLCQRVSRFTISRGSTDGTQKVQTATYPALKTLARFQTPSSLTLSLKMLALDRAPHTAACDSNIWIFLVLKVSSPSLFFPDFGVEKQGKPQKKTSLSSERHSPGKGSWEKESIHRPAPAQNFSLPKKWGPHRKDYGGRYGFPGFHRVFVSTTDLESFSLRPEKFPKRFSFGGCRVRFSLLWAGKRSKKPGIPRIGKRQSLGASNWLVIRRFHRKGAFFSR